MSTLAGTPSLVEQPVTRGIDAQRGPFITRTWKGTQDAALAGLDEIVGADYAEVTGNGAVYTLTARFANDPADPQTETPVHEERLHFNRITESIYKHPNYSALDTATIRAIRTAIDNRQELPASLIGAAAELYALALAGVESFIINQPVVIVTDTASAKFPWDIGFDGVGAIFTTAEMIADAELESGWADNLPVETSPASGLEFGWLKGPPEITTVGGNRSQLVQEYEYGLWATTLYS